MTNHPTSSCPDCGTTLPPGSPQSLCPACLLRQALASRTIDGENSKPASPPPAPEEIADKFPQFEITECLGRGGMGVVYKARQKSLDRWVAIKILAPERVGDDKFAGRFAREAQTLAKLNHPNIVTVYDYGETDGLYFIVMEFVDGVNLRDLVREGKLAAEQALAIVPPICEALQFAHQRNIVHRDIKPENLLLDQEGRIKIADFGIATLIGTNSEQSGTPPYMAPEQRSTQARIDHRADIYALGVVLYEMLTGQRPNSDPTSTTSHPDARIDQMVRKAMASEPDERFQSAEEFRTVATQAAPSSSPPAPPTLPPSASSPSPKGMFRRWWWIFVLAVFAAPVFTAVVVYVLSYAQPKRFESTAMIQVHPNPGVSQSQFMATQFEGLTATETLRQVSKELDLPTRWLLPEQEVLKVLRSSIQVENLRGTDLIAIRARHTSSSDAAAVANTVAQVYMVRMKALQTEASGNRDIPRSPVVIHELASENTRGSGGSSRKVALLTLPLSLLLLPCLALLLMAILQKLVPEKAVSR